MKKIDLYAQIQEKTGICAPSRSNFMDSSCTKFEASHHYHGETFALYSLLPVKVVKIRYDFNDSNLIFKCPILKKKQKNVYFYHHEIIKRYLKKSESLIIMTTNGKAQIQITN